MKIAFLILLLGLLFLAVRAQLPQPGILVQRELYPLQLAYMKGPPAVPNAPVLLEFWGVNCPPCLESIPHLNQLYAQFRPRGLQIVGVTQDAPGEVYRFVQRLPIHYAIANDPSQQYYEALNVSGIPDALLLDATGMIKWRGHPMELTPEILETVMN